MTPPQLTDEEADAQDLHKRPPAARRAAAHLARDRRNMAGAGRPGGGASDPAGLERRRRRGACGLLVGSHLLPDSAAAHPPSPVWGSPEVVDCSPDEFRVRSPGSTWPARCSSAGLGWGLGVSEAKAEAQLSAGSAPGELAILKDCLVPSPYQRQDRGPWSNLAVG